MLWFMPFLFPAHTYVLGVLPHGAKLLPSPPVGGLLRLTPVDTEHSHFFKSVTNLVAKMAFHCYFITIIYLLAIFLSFWGIRMFFAHFLLGYLLPIYMDTHNFKAKWGAPMTTLSDFTDSDSLPFNPHFPGEDPALKSSPPSPAWTPVKVSSTHFTPRQD